METEHAAATFAALGQPTRLALIHNLQSAGPEGLPAGEIAEALGVPPSTLSFHLRALEDALLEFAGTVMVISHDRWFLDRIATHILAFEGNSTVTFFDGNYQEYEADKKKRLGEEGAKPKRLRFKPLTV